MNYAVLLQDTTPDTSGYMIAGYIIFAVIMAIYIVSFLARGRNLERDLSTLESMKAESKAMAPQPPRKRGARKAKAVKAQAGRRGQAGKRSAGRH
jgi:hypothetical protein